VLVVVAVVLAGTVVLVLPTNSAGTSTGTDTTGSTTW
jgi:hypothetical protein